MQTNYFIQHSNEEEVNIFNTGGKGSCAGLTESQY